MTSRLHRARRNDILLIASLVFLALVGILLSLCLRRDGAYCVITKNGEEVGRFSLSADREITYYEEDGVGFNTVRIENGRVSVTAASCPDKICVRSRAIRYHGETVVCLPHGLVVTVYGDEEGPDIIV